MPDDLPPSSSDQPTAADFDMRVVVPVPEVNREAVGDVIGRYKLLREVGEGGFGSVWMARQSEPVIRTVALKIIKLGMDTRQVIARFEAERQALAMMDHPHIARVFDAGATASGRPYFVMEFCTGQPITSYCDANHLPIPQRLSLLLDVCSAVQHAHAKGVIHRDIKPSNVLVSTVDGRPAVKVIDFGIAKATSGRLADRTFVTEAAQFVGTPEYMSPEQADGSLDVDTRADVYSLGVLTYALLTGSTPFSAGELRSAAAGEMQRIIREVDPPKPSTRISQSGDTLSAVAQHRGIEPDRLRTVVRGELDWIVMRAIEKDRARRYETPSALADDLRRYLSGDPVLAVPPSRAYLLSKLFRRNRIAVVAGGAVAATLLAGIVAFAWQARVARHQRDLAVAAQQSEAEQRRAADAQRDRAVAAEAEEKRRSEQLRVVSDFQSQMLAQVDPATAGARLTADVRARFDTALAKSGIPESDRATHSAAFADQWTQVNATDAARALIDLTILRPADAAIDDQFKDQPALAATLRQTLADRYGEIGLYERSIALATRARDDRARLLGPDHRDTLASANNLGSSLVLAGKLADAEKVLRDSLDRARRALGDRDPVTLQGQVNLGACLKEQDRLLEAEALIRPSLEAHRQVLGPDAPATLDTVEALASLLWRQGKFADAESLLRDLVARSKRVHGADAQPTVNSTNLLSTVLQDAGKLDDATPFAQAVVDADRRRLGEDHPGTLTAKGNLAALLQSQGKLPEAIALGREVLAARLRIFGPASPDVLLTEGNLGSALMESNNLAEAEPLLKSVLDNAPRAFGENHREVLRAANAYGGLLMRQGKLSLAEPYWRRAYEGGRSALGPDHPDTLIWTNNLAAVLNQLGKPAEAEPLFRHAIAGFERSLGRDSYNAIAAAGGLALSLGGQEKFAEAEPLARETIDRWTRFEGPDGPESLALLDHLAAFYRSDHKLPESIAAYRHLVEVLRKRPGRAVLAAAGTATTLAGILEETHDFPGAEIARRDALTLALAAVGEGKPEALSAAVNLSGTLSLAGKYDEAEKLSAPAAAELERTLGHTHVRTAVAKLMLGCAHLGQKRYAEAESELLVAEPIIAASTIAPPERHRRCLESLATLYAEWDKQDPTKNYAAKSAEWKAKLSPPK